MTTTTTKRTRKSKITKATRERIRKLVARQKLTYKEIATKCKVSTGTVGRFAKETST